MKKKRVMLIVAAPCMVLVDDHSNFLLQRPISKHVRQEIKHIVKKRNYEIINKECFTWL